VCVERINSVEHAEHADGPTPIRRPDFKDFQRVTELLQVLRDKDMYEGARSDEKAASVLRFKREAATLPEYHELAGLLELDPDRRVFFLSDSIGRQDSVTLHIKTRSFQGVMYFLSNAVQVPEADIAARRVPVSLQSDGSVFDWSAVMDDLLNIKSSKEPPDNAAVAVRHRGHWFYIDDADIDSKSTFSMIGQIFALQSGSVNIPLPMLTLPVGD
jgi:hypothetical protein